MHILNLTMRPALMQMDAQTKSGYEASSHADSLSSGSCGKYVPPHIRQGHPYLLSKSITEES